MYSICKNINKVYFNNVAVGFLMKKSFFWLDDKQFPSITMGFKPIVMLGNANYSPLFFL